MLHTVSVGSARKDMNPTAIMEYGTLTSSDHAERLSVMELNNRSQFLNAEQKSWTSPSPDDTSRSSVLWMSAVPLVALTLMNILANGIILTIFIRSKCIKKCRNVYILSLALSDFLVGITMPFSVIETLNSRWTFSAQSCLVFLTIRSALLLISVSSIVLLTIDRWWCINFPISYRIRKSRRTAAILVATIWLASFIIHIPISFTTNDAFYSGYSTRYCSFFEPYRTEITIISSSITCFVPVLVLIVLNIVINITLFKRRNTKKLRRSLSSNESSLLFTRKYSVDSNHSTSTSSDDNNTIQRVVDPRRNSYVIILAKRTSLNKLSNPFHKTSSLQLPRQRPLDTMLQRDKNGNPSFRHSFPNRKQSDEVVRDFLVRQDKKAILSLCLLAIMALVCLMPYYTTTVINVISTDVIQPWTLLLTYWICVSNSAINPFLYGFGNSDLRKTIHLCMQCKMVECFSFKEILKYCRMSSTEDLDSLSDLHMKKRKLQYL